MGFLRQQPLRDSVCTRCRDPKKGLAEGCVLDLSVCLNAWEATPMTCYQVYIPRTYREVLMLCGCQVDSLVRRPSGAACRRAIQRILVRTKEHYENGQYESTTDAENEFRRLVESDLACK